jgi:hypothetical protein
MKKKLFSFLSDRTDRRLMALSLIGLLLSALPLVSENIYQKILGQSSRTSNKPIIGEISLVKNDIRHKEMDSFAWEKASAAENVRLGDSVFTGEKSLSRVTLKDGSHIDLDQNSLVRFSKIDSIEVPNLTLGNFRISVNGTMNIAIGGELTVLDGDGSEVQIEIKENKKPQIRLLKGSAQIKKAKVARILTPNRITPMSEPAPEEPRKNVEPPKQVRAEPKIFPKPVQSSLVYTDELYDLYENRDGRLFRRANRRVLLKFPVSVTWASENHPGSTLAQLSSAPDFLNVPVTFTVAAGEFHGEFKSALLGANYFRLSADGHAWSDPTLFEVSSRFLGAPPPHLDLNSKKLAIIEESVDVVARVESDLPNYVLETSSSPEFLPNNTRIDWGRQKTIRLKISEPTTLFMRTRGVNAALELTEFSKTVRVDIEKPELPRAPRLAESELHVFEGDAVVLNWPSVPRAKRYQLQIQDAKGHALFRQHLDFASSHFQANQTGTFRVKIVAEDGHGRKSKEAADVFLVVRPKLQIMVGGNGSQEKDAGSPVAVAAEQPREPAAEATLSQKITTDIPPDYLNRNFSSSLFSFEGAAFTMYSQQQATQNLPNPTAMMVGLHWLGWSGSQGLEAYLKTKMVDLSSTPGDEVSPLLLEGRYHYRWNLPFNPFSKYGRSQVSWIAGYEYYNNPVSGPFSPGYNLFKTGFDLSFPILHRWDTGGEVLYGQGLDSSVLYEISGYLHYFFEKQWSLGIGYRVNLFQAGSSASAPSGAPSNGVPYREGYGEGFSELRWHY